MRGVCKRRETRVITPRPMKLASMKTKSIAGQSVAGGGLACGAVSGADWARRGAAESKNTSSSTRHWVLSTKY
jgi:hypothetical protein